MLHRTGLRVASIRRAVAAVVDQDRVARGRIAAFNLRVIVLGVVDRAVRIAHVVGAGVRVVRTGVRVVQELTDPARAAVRRAIVQVVARDGCARARSASAGVVLGAGITIVARVGIVSVLARTTYAGIVRADFAVIAVAIDQAV